jgi:ABC-2 type transport system ATP-binding protein
MIEAADLTKRFGSTLAVDGLSFTVRPGYVTGFLGPNGAGKSTTMRMILGLDRPTRGSVTVNGKPYDQLRRPLHQIGAVLEVRAMHSGRSAYHHLLCLAQASGIPARRVNAVLELVGLESVGRKRAGKFSLGMSQRLGLAAALLGDPAVLILDEPFNGMDPEGIIWMRGFLRGLAAAGRAVLVSSHLMSELQDTADHLVIVGRGAVIADTSTRALLAAASGDRVTLHTPVPAEAAEVLTADGAEVRASEPGVLLLSGMSSERAVVLLTKHAIAFTEVSAHRASLEEAYLELTGDAVEFRAVTR